MSSRYKPVPVNNAIVLAKEDLGISQTVEHDPYLRVMADQALRSIHSEDKYGQFSGLFEIFSGKVCLPDGFDSLLAFAFTDEDGCPIDGYDESLKGRVRINYGNTFTWNILPNDGGIMVFNCPEDIPSDFVKLFWHGRNVDNNGFTLMLEQEERAVAAYLCYKFSRRYPKEYQQGIIQDYKREWTQQKAFLRGNATLNNYKQNKNKIHAIWDAYVTYKSLM
jgi:hypothetical protein